eukprot:scaffold136572_cov163-Phaeocystis_antarctica.AAC.1
MARLPRLRLPRIRLRPRQPQPSSTVAVDHAIVALACTHERRPRAASLVLCRDATQGDDGRAPQDV